MCGRYVHPDEAAIERAWHVGRDNGNPFRQRFNVLPTTTVPVLMRTEAEPGLRLVGARWQFIPSWWKQPRPPTSTINARSEEAAVKPMWRTPWRHGAAHCLVVAAGWYEWRAVEMPDTATGEMRTVKQPWFIHRADGAPFSFAGLTSWWTPPGGGDAVLTCAILTRTAAPGLAALHDRMPVVLAEPAWESWTDPALHDPDEASRIVDGALLDGFAFHMVKPLVNSRKAEGAELVEAIDPT